MSQKKKRYYEVGEIVHIKDAGAYGEILELNIAPQDNLYKALVEVTHDDVTITKEFNLWEIDKDKRVYRKKEPVGLDKAYEQVRKFQEAFGHPVSDIPTAMEIERARARAEWMREEIDEFLEATNVIDQSDAMIDLMYFALGTLVEMGVKPEKLFNIVQDANMAKLWEDGKPRFREDGKVMKPEGWEAPEPKLHEEIYRQINQMRK